MRSIAKEFGHSRNTVRKTLLDVKPEYHREIERCSPVMDRNRAVILSWSRSGKEIPRKQRHTARRIYSRLVDEHDFQGAKSTVRRLKIDDGLFPSEELLNLICNHSLN